MPIFRALVVTERKQKTPLTFLDFEEPDVSEGEFLVENVAAAQASSASNTFNNVD